MERLGRIPEVKIILPIDFHTSSLCWETVVENFAHKMRQKISELALSAYFSKNNMQIADFFPLIICI
jgi:hypothetical protein